MRHWIEAARRTLPLSVSGIIVGSMYALAINGLYRGQLENI
jgi:1,4-dihydroxy-2-naphthoate octaprenyltransferase